MGENTYDKVVSSSKRAAANRRSAQLSTGPRTEKGKSRSRYNALLYIELLLDVLWCYTRLDAEGVFRSCQSTCLLSECKVPPVAPQHLQQTGVLAAEANRSSL